MDETARQIFSQVGFPLRRSLIGYAFSHGFRLREGSVQADLSVVDTSSRLVLALRILFERVRGAAGGAPAHHEPPERGASAAV